MKIHRQFAQRFSQNLYFTNNKLFDIIYLSKERKKENDLYNYCNYYKNYLVFCRINYDYLVVKRNKKTS